MEPLTKETAEGAWMYDPSSGHFTWLLDKGRAKAGSRAGNFDGGYWRLQYAGKNYKASRVAWLMMTGAWPPNQIDHINGDKLDDRFCNLRMATNAENCRNRGLKKTNKLRVKGVCLHGKKYIAQIFVGGKNKRLGSFLTLEEASAAYSLAAKRFYGEFSRT